MNKMLYMLLLLLLSGCHSVTVNSMESRELLSCTVALPDCLLEGKWPKSFSGLEVKSAVEEFVDACWTWHSVEFEWKGLQVGKLAVVSELCNDTYASRIEISRVEDLPIIPSDNFNPVIARLEDALAMICENYGVRYVVRDGKIVIVPSRIENGSRFGNEYEDLVKALMAKCKVRRLPYEESIMVRWWNAFDKSRQEEYANAMNGVVLPLGCHSHEDVVENRGDVPASFIGRLKVSLAGDRKCLLHTARDGDRVLCAIDSTAYAVLSVRMGNVDTDQETVSVKQLPPSSDLPGRGIAEGEMLLVLTPQGLFARPWYSRQFNYYWFGQDGTSVVK